ncbi:hypothetical protein PLICRDRAFT_699463 [Plicaturopsis crispa FD-325 SS-3]|nr:hypothetical protein PLICRDRAFT_699463 [Plicaturopsis crispa FD-325 SS-3]
MADANNSGNELATLNVQYFINLLMNPDDAVRQAVQAMVSEHQFALRSTQPNIRSDIVSDNSDSDYSSEDSSDEYSDDSESEEPRLSPVYLPWPGTLPSPAAQPHTQPIRVSPQQPAPITPAAPREAELPVAADVSVAAPQPMRLSSLDSLSRESAPQSVPTEQLPAARDPTNTARRLPPPDNAQGDDTNTSPPQSVRNITVAAPQPLRAAGVTFRLGSAIIQPPPVSEIVSPRSSSQPIPTRAPSTPLGTEEPVIPTLPAEQRLPDLTEFSRSHVLDAVARTDGSRARPNPRPFNINRSLCNGWWRHSRVCSQSAFDPPQRKVRMRTHVGPVGSMKPQSMAIFVEQDTYLTISDVLRGVVRCYERPMTSENVAMAEVYINDADVFQQFQEKVGTLRPGEDVLDGDMLGNHSAFYGMWVTPEDACPGWVVNIGFTTLEEMTRIGAPPSVARM